MSDYDYDYEKNASEEVVDYLLLLKNIPKEATHNDQVALYVENATGEEVYVDKVQFSNDKTEAIIAFKQPSLSLDEAIERIHNAKRLLYGVRLEALIAPECNKLLVQGLKDEINKEDVELYFESRKFGNPEVDVQFDSLKHMAIISYQERSVMDMVLNHSEHASMLGPNVVIEQCGYFTSLDGRTSRSGLQSQSSELASRVQRNVDQSNASEPCLEEAAQLQEDESCKPKPLYRGKSNRQTRVWRGYNRSPRGGSQYFPQENSLSDWNEGGSQEEKYEGRGHYPRGPRGGNYTRGNNQGYWNEGGDYASQGEKFEGRGHNPRGPRGGNYTRGNNQGYWNEGGDYASQGEKFEGRGHNPRGPRGGNYTRGNNQGYWNEGGDYASQGEKFEGRGHNPRGPRGGNYTRGNYQGYWNEGGDYASQGEKFEGRGHNPRGPRGGNYTHGNNQGYWNEGGDYASQVFDGSGRPPRGPRGRSGKRNPRWQGGPVRAQSLMDVNLDDGSDPTHSSRGNEGQVLGGFRGRVGSFENLHGGRMASGATRGDPFGGGRTSEDSDRAYGDMAASSKKKFNKEIIIQNEVSSEKCTLLVYLVAQLKHFGCTVLINKKTHTVSVTGGSQESVDETLALVYRNLTNFHPIELNKISTQLASHLSSQRGLKWISEQFRENDLCAASYVKGDIVCLVAENEITAMAAERLVMNEITVRDMPFDSSQLDFIRSKAWTNFISNVEKNGIIAIHVLESPTMLIRMEGVLKHVEAEAQNVEKLLKEKCVIVEEVHTSCSSEVRYLKEYYKDYCTGKFNATINAKKKEKKLVISGQKEDVTRVKISAENHLRTLRKEEFEDNRPGITEAMFKDKFSIYAMTIVSLENKWHCIIDIQNAGSSHRYQPSVVSRDSSSHRYDSRKHHSPWMVAKGDIAKFQADVLVNSVASESGDLNEAGAVSKAFLAVGGPNLQQEYLNNYRRSPKELCITSATGNLQAKNVFHVYVPKYRPKQGLVRALGEKIQNCITKAASMGMNSIAFPTIGCGYLSYEPRKVKKCFETSISRAGSTNIKVHVVAFDDKMCSIFQADASREHQSRTRDVKSEDTQPERNPVKFTIIATNQAHLSNVKDEITRGLEKFIATKDITFSGELTATDVQLLRQLRTAEVDIQIHKSSRTIELSGVQEKFKEVSGEVKKILSRSNSSGLDLENIKRTASTKEYLQALSSAADIQAPKYWTKYQGSLNKVASSMGILTQLNGKLERDVTALVMSTWNASSVGKGQDAMNLNHRNISVRKVWVVENPSLYRCYLRNMQELCREKPQGVPPVKGLLNETEIETILKGSPDLQGLLVAPTLNECFLFHGTSHKDAIIKDGLDLRLGNNNALFGMGCYFAESSTKADQYADKRDARVANGQPMYMFLSRVLLGHTFICQRPWALKRPPCTDSNCNSDLCSTHERYERYHSVLGTHKFQNPIISQQAASMNQAQRMSQPAQKLLFREFIVYDKNQCYPEFLIEYVRQ